MSDKYTTKRTELPITISTDYEHKKDDLLESVRQQIEQSGFHLQTLFNNLKRSALFMESYVSESESDELKSFCSDLINTADVGNGLCMNVWRSISELTALQTDEDSTSDTETPVKATAKSEVQKSDALQLAEKISYLIMSEEVPAPFSNALADAVNDFYNHEIDQNTMREFENSPAYISELLKSSSFFTVDGEKTSNETEADDENL